MPRFTILLAARNAERWIEESLRSVRAQSDASWQLLCADDASTDGTLRVLRHAAAQDGRIRVVEMPENVGQAAARNRLLPLAEGDFTLMLDADDRLAPDALAALADALAGCSGADAAVMRLVKTWPDGREEEHATRGLPRVMTGREAFLHSLDWTLHGLYAVRTELHRRIPFDDRLRLYSDDNTARLHYMACRKVVLSDATYYYRQHADSATHRLTPERICLLEAGLLLRASVEAACADREALCRLEEHCWRNYVAVWREMHALSPTLAPDERAAVCRRLRRCFAEVKPRRLARRIWRYPSTFYLPAYPLFCAWQKLLLHAGRYK